MSRPFARRNRRILLIVIAVVLLAALSPGYSRVIIKEDGVDLDVQSAGFGPQHVRVETENAKVESATR